MTTNAKFENDLIDDAVESAERPKANLLVVDAMTNRYRLDRPPTMHTDETREPARVSEPTPIVDLWQHEREEYRKVVKWLQESRIAADTNRDELQRQLAAMNSAYESAHADEIAAHKYACQILPKEIADELPISVEQAMGCMARHIVDLRAELAKWKNAVCRHISGDLDHDGTPVGMVDALLDLVATKDVSDLRTDLDKLQLRYEEKLNSMEIAALKEIQTKETEEEHAFRIRQK